MTTLAETPTTLTLTATAIGRCGHEVTYTATEKFKEPFTALGRFRAEDRHRQRTPKRHCSPACRRKSAGPGGGADSQRRHALDVFVI